MIKTPELDRAIEAGTKAVCGTTDKLIIADRRKQRAYARALVAELLRDMDQPPLDPPAILGWDLAIQVIKRRAGLEDEG